MLIYCDFSPELKQCPVKHICMQYLLSVRFRELSGITVIERASQFPPALENCLPSFLNGCKQIAAKQNSGHWAFSQFVLLCSMCSPALLLWGIFVMSPVFHIHRTWTICCSQHIWDIISSGMSPDIVLLTGQRDIRIKVSLVREYPWLNFQILKISRTHWKKQEKAVLFYSLWQHFYWLLITSIWPKS